MRHAEDMGVDGQCGFVESDGLDHVGRLASHSGKTGQLLERRRHFAMKVRDELLGEPHEVLGLGVGIADGATVVVDDLGCGFGHGFGSRVVGKEAWGDLVDALVGALGREHHGHDELEVVLKVKLGLGGIHRALKKVEDVGIEFFLSHAGRAWSQA